MVKTKKSVDWKSIVSSRLFIFVCSVLIFDRLTKLIITRACPCIINPLLNFITVMNRGVAFGMFQNGFFSNIIFMIVTLLAVAFITYLYQNEMKDDRIKLGLAFMIGGALGNLLDRVLYGEVIDIFDLHVSIWHFPTFNIADSAITIGAILVIWFTFRNDVLKKKPIPTSKKKSTRKKAAKKSVRKSTRK